MKVLLIDMDNTLNRLWEKFVEHYNILYRKNETITRDEMLAYDIPNNIHSIRPEIKEDVKNFIFSKQSFWSNIEIFDSDTIRVFDELNKKYETYICTVPWSKYLDCYRDKVLWMKKHFDNFDTTNMIFAKKKHLIAADYLIDDSPEYLTGSKLATIAMDFPYNKNVETSFRVKGWKEIGDILL